jgi:hypothetical protein
MPEVEPVTSAALPLSIVVLVLLATPPARDCRRKLPLFLLHRNIYV